MAALLGYKVAQEGLGVLKACSSATIASEDIQLKALVGGRAGYSTSVSLAPGSFLGSIS